MLHLTALCSSLLIGTPAGVASAARVDAPQMMPKFLKELFPNLEKPEAKVVSVDAPAAAIVAAGKGMPLLSPIFGAEAILQALVLNLGSYDEEEVQAEIAETIKKAPVVIYTYPLSPFSSEAVSVLESTGCKFENVPLGLEWFLLGPKASATRVELKKLYGQGSLPHVFIGGEWVGGLATGAEGGLAGLVERGELADKLKKARAL